MVFESYIIYDVKSVSMASWHFGVVDRIKSNGFYPHRILWILHAHVSALFWPLSHYY